MFSSHIDLGSDVSAGHPGQDTSIGPQPAISLRIALVPSLRCIHAALSPFSSMNLFIFPEVNGLVYSFALLVVLFSLIHHVVFLQECTSLHSQCSGVSFFFLEPLLCCCKSDSCSIKLLPWVALNLLSPLVQQFPLPTSCNSCFLFLVSLK